MKHYILYLLLTITFSCTSQDCKDLPSSYNSYSEAVKSVKNSSFEFEEKTDTFSSSWINSAKYYSCDSKKGYLLIKTKSKTYIHSELPIRLWNRFKTADSKGKFYNKFIKKNYTLSLN